MKFLFDNKSDVTVVLTSCGRFDLLERTLESFAAYNTYPVKKIIITEDSGDDAVYDVLPDEYKNFFTVIVNKPKSGQIKSIDTAYALVDTPYIFHCEDDWEFYRSHFIEDSRIVLENDEQALLVWLRDFHFDISINYPDHFLDKPFTYNNLRCHRLGPYCKEISPNQYWYGFTFNPGLRRLKDYKALGRYQDIGHEPEMSQYYAGKKYAVILENSAVAHIGIDRHVIVEEQERKKRSKKRIRVLKRWLYFVAGLVLGAVITYLLR